MKITYQVVLILGSLLLINISYAEVVGKIREIQYPGTATGSALIMLEGATVFGTCQTFPSDIVGGVPHIGFFLNMADPSLYKQNLAVLTAAKLNGSTVRFKRGSLAVGLCEIGGFTVF